MSAANHISGVFTFYHGTDWQSAVALLNGQPLDAAAAAARKIDGPPGFFLAMEPSAAEYAALRRAPGSILQYTLSNKAMMDLLDGGAQFRKIPFGGGVSLPGDELYVPIGLFQAFNHLRAVGEITVRGYAQ